MNPPVKPPIPRTDPPNGDKSLTSISGQIQAVSDRIDTVQTNLYAEIVKLRTESAKREEAMLDTLQGIRVEAAGREGQMIQVLRQVLLEAQETRKQAATINDAYTGDLRQRASVSDAQGATLAAARARAQADLLAIGVEREKALAVVDVSTRKAEADESIEAHKDRVLFRRRMYERAAWVIGAILVAIVMYFAARAGVALPKDPGTP